MTYASEVLADSPLLYWRLGEASGTAATDASGNGRHGTYVGSPTLGTTGLLTGDANTAATFASGQYASVADTTDLTAFSVECWVKTTSSMPATIACRDTGYPNRIFRLDLTGGGDVSGLAMAATGSSFTVLSSGVNIRDGVRHHVVFTFDPTASSGNRLKIYLDGTLNNSDAMSSPTLITSDVPFSVGSATYGTFAGVVDEVAYYSSALSGARVAAHYAAGTTAPPPPAAELTVAATVPAVSGSLTLDVATPPQMHASAVAPPVVGSLSLRSQDLTGLRVDGQIQPVSAAVAVRGVVGGQANRSAGWTRDNIGEAQWTPDVVEPPAAIAPQRRVIAQAYTAPSIDGTHALLEPTYATTPAHRDRIVVGGRDITYWRDTPTPTPDYQWVQPLGYGAATFSLPQAVIPFETPGVGALSWLREGASVLVQRVDTETGAVVATDWRGIVIAFSLAGNSLTVECGGAATGRASLQDRQQMLVQQRLDAGTMVARAMRQIRVRHEPALGTATGIRLLRWGGGGMLDFINELVSKMVTTSGQQWTVMPDANGVFRTALRDTTTIHGTVYLDDARVKGDLRSDLAEKPNRIFASGVTPEGMVVKFGAYPGLVQAAAPPYPFDDNAPFGEGTEDADTDTGDGVTVMGWRLHATGYLEARTDWDTYDAGMAEAIRDLKREAKLKPVTGTMTPAAWRALFDLSATGYSLRNIRVLPAAAADEVTPWRLSANGSLIARNPAYDPSVVPVDRTIAMGAGFTRTQIRQWARKELVAANGWRGTIEITTGAIVAGNHTPGAPIGSILRARDIRPGMNLRLPLFAGGITVHVAGVSVTDDGQTVTLAVDTKPGDTLPVWAAIQRDRENRETVHRSFNRQRRAASLERENTFDEVGGRVPPIKLDEGWNVFPVVAKQAGTIQKLAVTLNPEREFVIGVFGRRISRATLRAVTNAPLSEAGSKRWTSEAWHNRLDRRYVMLYVAGSDLDPCGYFPGRKSEGASLLTGRHQDDASFPFVTYSNDTDRGSVLWVAVWVPGATTLRGGRIMWPSAEDY